MATYRIAVGKRHKVEPRQIVGAIANEGGLGRQDFGHIDIRADHSLVELPADLPAGTWDKLRGTRISGQLIDLEDIGHGGGGMRPGAGRSSGGSGRIERRLGSEVERRFGRPGRPRHGAAGPQPGRQPEEGSLEEGLT